MVSRHEIEADDAAAAQGETFVDSVTPGVTPGAYASPPGSPFGLNKRISDASDSFNWHKRQSSLSRAIQGLRSPLGERPTTPSVQDMEQDGQLDPVTLHTIARTSTQAEAARAMEERSRRERSLDVHQGGRASVDVPLRHDRFSSISTEGTSSTPPMLASPTIGTNDTPLTPMDEREISFADSTKTDASASSKPKKTLFSRLGLGKAGKTHSRTPSEASQRSPSQPALQVPRMMRSTSGESIPKADNASIVTDASGHSKRSRYIRVRTRNKAKKEFGSLYLAQELHLDPRHEPPASGRRLSISASRPSTSASRPSFDQASTNGSSTGHTAASTDGRSSVDEEHTPRSKQRRPAIWTMQFSPDGQYLAAAGQDGVVRVWQVLQTPEQRRNAVATTPGLRGLLRRSSTGLLSDQSGHAPCASEGATSTTTTSNRRRAHSTVIMPGSPIFSNEPVFEFEGHTADVLDLCWSKNNFLLSCGMDRSVRLWHVSRSDCLCAFQHPDFVTSVAFRA